MARRRYRRQSPAGSMATDAAYIANRLPWQGALILGIVLFVIFYWLIPAWLQNHIASIDSKNVRPVIEAMYGRRIHWFQWLGVALALICGFFTVRNYFRSRRLRSAGERDVGYFGRLIARFLD
jgi:hypothetical protein